MVILNDDFTGTLISYANDTKGHEAGDTLIKTIGQGIKEAVAADGKVFRIGGDEFMVVLLTDKEERGKEIIKKTEEIFKAKSEELGMPVSAASGVAVRIAGEDVSDAMKRADESMYSSKQLYYQQVGNDRRK